MDLIERIDLHVASTGNDFMEEIAQWYATGFRELGLDSRVYQDTKPVVDTSTLSLIVAPHEYVPLFLDRHYSDDNVSDTLKACGVINTEQPGSDWFTLAAEMAYRCRYVFDINPQGAEGLRRRGIPASYVPLGFVSSLDRSNEGNAKRNDIVFLGHDSPRRARFFSDNADFFHSYACKLVFAPLDQPRRQGNPNYLGRTGRDRILRSSKVLLNVHSYARSYFEWHRAIIAISNGCVLVTETSHGASPLVPGEHFVMADLSQLTKRCGALLESDHEQQQISANAIACLTDELPITRSCERLLEVVEAIQPQTANRTCRRSLGRHFHDAKAAGRRVARFLRLRRIAKTLAMQPVWARIAESYSNRSNDPSARQLSIRRDELIRLQTTSANRESDFEEVCSPEKNASPDISVVVTLYNYAAHISDCISSVENSDISKLPSGIELVVVDDASSDDSIDIAEASLSQLSVPWKLVKKKHNTGLAEARNLGMRQACGKYIFILDADNKILRHCLQKLYCAIRSGNYTAAYGIIAKFDHSSGNGLGLISNRDWDVRSLVVEPYIDAMAMFDRVKMIELGGYDSKMIRYGWFGWEDYEMWLRIADARLNVKYVSEILSRYRSHSTSMISTTNQFRGNLSSYLFERYNALLNEFNPSSEICLGSFREHITVPIDLVTGHEMPVATDPTT